MTTRTLLAVAAAGAFAGFTRPAAARAGDGCVGRHPNYVEDLQEVRYNGGCTGHDEPELFPISSAPGSARELTWTVVLPTSTSNGDVSATGPTFWFGGTVTDPNSLFGQAFVELQFYPDALVTQCSQNGGFNVKYQQNTYTACSPVWMLTSTGVPGNFHEPAAFNAMLTDGASKNPLVMHAGDTVTIHWFTTPAKDGFHVTVTDLNTGHSGTIVLNSQQDGPLMPAYNTQTIGNSLQWGGVYDAPNSFVWEIGHTSPFTSPGAQFCVPGDTDCDSYNAASWAATLPIQIKGVTFGDGSVAKKWGVVSDFGGKAEVVQYCPSYGGPFCIYPWYTLGTDGFHYGVDFPGNLNDFGQASQFTQTQQCGGPFGPNTTYCSTILK